MLRSHIGRVLGRVVKKAQSVNLAAASMIYRAQAKFTDCVILATRPRALSVCDCTIRPIPKRKSSMDSFNYLFIISGVTRVSDLGGGANAGRTLF